MKRGQETPFGIVVIVAALSIVMGGISCAGGCGSDYSDGERSGVVVKLSRKGVLFKSWEGTMNVGGTSVDANGVAVPITWDFSISRDSIAEEVRKAATSGKRITLGYKQWLVKPATVGTDYDVTGVLGGGAGVPAALDGGTK